MKTPLRNGNSNGEIEKPEEIDIFTTLTDGSPVYYIPSDVHKPSWLKSFFLQDGNNDMWQANSRVVLIKRIKINFLIFFVYKLYKKIYFLSKKPYMF